MNLSWKSARTFQPQLGTHKNITRFQRARERCEARRCDAVEHGRMCHFDCQWLVGKAAPTELQSKLAESLRTQLCVGMTSVESCLFQNQVRAGFDLLSPDRTTARPMVRPAFSDRPLAVRTNLRTTARSTVSLVTVAKVIRLLSLIP